MFVLKRKFDDEAWSVYECPNSTRVSWDTYAANFKARLLVRERQADEAQVLDESGKQISLWQWNPHAKEARQIFGPEL